MNWTKSFLGLDIKPSLVAKYLSKVNVERIDDRSWKFYQECYIHGVYIAKTDDMCHMKAHCYHSQKASEEAHDIKMEFDSPNSLKTSHCSCTVG